VHRISYTSESMFSPTRSKYISRMAIITGSVITAAVALFGISELRYGFEARTLDATVEKLESAALNPTKSPLTFTSYVAIYEFSLPGETTRRTGRGELSQRRFQQLKVGERLPIQVIQNQPSLNRPLEPHSWSGTILVVLGGIGLFLLVVGAKLRLHGSVESRP